MDTGQEAEYGCHGYACRYRGEVVPKLVPIVRCIWARHCGDFEGNFLLQRLLFYKAIREEKRVSTRLRCKLNSN